MNRFTPFIEPRRDSGFCDGLVVGALSAALLFAGGFAAVLILLS